MSKIIFYFSGTGNSFAVSRLVANKLEETEITPIAKIKNYAIAEYDTVGFVFPVYYIHAPEIVVHSLSGIKFNQFQQIFIIATYGGSWGYALSDVRFQISSNGAKNIQEFRIKMPGNYILEYGASPLFYQKTLLNKAEKNLTHIVNTIAYKRPTKPISCNLLARLFRHNGDRKINSFHDMGTKFSVKESCQSCGICQKICPVENIKMSNGNIVWGNKCQQCMACIQWCPYHAIAHPLLKGNRKRYTHPDISLQQLRR